MRRVSASVAAERFSGCLRSEYQSRLGRDPRFGAKLAHFVTRYGPAALDPPCAPLVFLNCRCVPRTQTLLREFVTTEMLEAATAYLQSQNSTVSPLGTVSRGEARASSGSGRSEMARQSMSLSEIAAELADIPSYSRDGHVVYQL